MRRFNLHLPLKVSRSSFCSIFITTRDLRCHWCGSERKVLKCPRLSLDNLFHFRLFVGQTEILIRSSYTGCFLTVTPTPTYIFLLLAFSCTKLINRVVIQAWISGHFFLWRKAAFPVSEWRMFVDELAYSLFCYFTSSAVKHRKLQQDILKLPLLSYIPAVGIRPFFSFWSLFLFRSYTSEEFVHLLIFPLKFPFMV